ncbi:Tn3 family transposase [Nonomuraea sp. GTA35]|uniref:Tn3 family transposase n=1 Tax=Nonomuraea sp. GTA35 TaxID=1676746 RepID=UPI0035BF5189
MQGFIELLLEVIRFRAVEAGAPVLAMVRMAAAVAKGRRRYGPGDVAEREALITGSWRPLVYRNPDLPEGQVDKAAFVLCAVMHLHHALRRRDVFAEGSERWSAPRAAPRARLPDGDAWQQARPRILTSLEPEVEPAGHLAELAGALEGAYARVLDGLGANTVVQFVGGRLQLAKLGAAEEPPLMKELRALLDDMLPRLDFPELLLEVFDRTGLPADFTHISGAEPSVEDFGVMADTRLWRTNTRAVYGPLEHMSRHTVRLDKIRAHWRDMLRVAGSLTMGTVRAYDLIRMLSADGRTTGLGEAFAHYGRISRS